MKKYTWLSLVVIFFLTSCEETIQLDLEQAGQRIVIEGLLTNRAQDQYVRVTRTLDFYQAGRPENVTDAAVSVRDDMGNTYAYVQAEPGYYIPDGTLQGQVGATYTLTVQVGQAVYESEDQLLPVADVDSISYMLNNNPGQTRIDKGHLYDLLLYLKEPKETEDYYLFKFYRNDSLTYTNSNDIYILSDEILSESIFGFPGPVYYAEQDTARMEMFSVSRDGYLFYSDLTNLLFSDGGLFGPVPANPRSNISNGALGFFQVSAVISEEVIIRPRN